MQMGMLLLGCVCHLVIVVEAWCEVNDGNTSLATNDSWGCPNNNLWVVAITMRMFFSGSILLDLCSHSVSCLCISLCG